MSETINPEDGAIPPRVTIKVPGQSGDVSLASDAANKKKTARLSLSQVSAEPGAAPAAPVSGIGVVSKTIRLAPSMTGQVAVSPLPSVGKAMTGTFVYDEVKRQTSRISLESALQGSTTSGAGVSAIPKTIKVKRPSISMGTGVSPAREDDSGEAAAAPSAAMSKSQTARVDISSDMVPEPQQTQKKTIKIRRGSDGGEAKAEPRSISIARTGAEGTPPSAAEAECAQPHGIFIGIAAAAILVLCFMIYVLAAQAYPSLGWSV